MINWRDDLKTGILLIDEQHKSLFETINKLDDCKNNDAIFNNVLIELRNYISTHFSTEEEYMRYTVYPDLLAHKSEHDRFNKELSALLKNSSSNGTILGARHEIIAYVESWITRHYSDEDVKMAAYLKSRSIK